MSTSLYRSLIEPDLRLMLRDGDEAGLDAFCQTFHPGLIAEIMEEIEPADVWRVLQHSDPETQAEIFQYFSLPDQEQLVEIIDRNSLSKIIEEMAPDDRVDLLERMDRDHVDALLPLIAQAERNDIKRLLALPEESAGSIMTTEYASLPADITAGDAINRLRVQAPSRETIYYIYVVDEQRHLQGLVSLRELIQSKPTRKVSELMQRDLIRAKVTADQEQVANDIIRLGFIAMPVVDEEDRLVGIITHDDAAAVQQEEATEDAHMQAAVSPLEDGYLDTALFTLAWKRGIWLMILVGAALGTVTVLQNFPFVGWMVLFMPLVAASGGNAGSQSATLIIRMLAVEEARGQKKNLLMAVLTREIRLGVLLGLTVGLMAFGMAILFVPAEQAGVVGLTVLMVVGFGAVTGALLPLVLKSLRLDPALMSNPMIAALVDVMGLLIYYSMARMLLTSA